MIISGLFHTYKLYLNYSPPICPLHRDISPTYFISGSTFERQAGDGGGGGKDEEVDISQLV